MIKLRATISDTKDLYKLIDVLKGNFNVLQVSREYENKKVNVKNMYKRVYIDLKEK